jgi:hypothetical protein
MPLTRYGGRRQIAHQQALVKGAQSLEIVIIHGMSLFRGHVDVQCEHIGKRIRRKGVA